VETPKRAIKFSGNEFYGGYLKKNFTTDGKMTQSYDFFFFFLFCKMLIFVVCLSPLACLRA